MAGFIWFFLLQSFSCVPPEANIAAWLKSFLTTNLACFFFFASFSFYLNRYNQLTLYEEGKKYIYIRSFFSTRRIQLFSSSFSIFFSSNRIHFYCAVKRTSLFFPRTAPHLYFFTPNFLVSLNYSIITHMCSFLIHWLDITAYIKKIEVREREFSKRKR